MSKFNEIFFGQGLSGKGTLSAGFGKFLQQESLQAHVSRRRNNDGFHGSG
jgi:hypothetical protein